MRLIIICEACAWLREMLLVAEVLHILEKEKGRTMEDIREKIVSEARST